MAEREYNTAVVVLTFDVTDEQVSRARARAAELDAMNLGEAAETYTPGEALARVLASDEKITHPLCSLYTDGYTAEDA